jgi:hypothetical protein
MFPTRRASARALLVAGVVGLAGCASDGGEGLFTTGALGTSSAANSDPQCISLATRIDMLRKEGIGDKIEKAAAKKYKMTQADLTKADQLTKANADFQLRCSPIMPDPTAAAEPAPTPAPAPKAKPKSASAPKQQPQADN